jgi:hypothetical protein
LAVLLVVLFLARNLIARKSVEVGAEKVTGFPLTIGSVDVGLFSSRVDVRNITLRNPPEFEERLFVDLPELSIDYRLGSVLGGAPHINEMTVEIKDLVLVKNVKGESNAAKLKGVLSSGDSASKYRIDTLHLRFKGTAVVKDFSKTKPLQKTIPLNIDATYHDITEATPITRLVLMTVVTQVRLPDIGVKPEDLTKGLENVAGKAGQVLKGATEAGKGLFDTIKRAVPGQDNK